MESTSMPILPISRSMGSNTLRMEGPALLLR